MTVRVDVAVAADAAPGSEQIVIVAQWDDWVAFGQGTARVVGDIIEIEPGTTSEQDVLVANNGSQLTGAGDGQARFADEDSSFVYRLPIPTDSRGTVTLDIANQFLVQASTDGQTWTTVLREPSAAAFQSNRAERTLNLADLREQAGGDGRDVYLRFGDSRPEDGWGGWLAGVRLDVAGGD